MSAVSVDLGERSYAVEVGSGLLGSPPQLPVPVGARAAVLADSAAWKAHGGPLQDALGELGLAGVSVLEIDPGEKSKSWDWAKRCCDFLAASSIGRDDWVLPFGGGVACDLGGFAAAVYLRGVSAVAFPTTLLAQVDASVGGKTAINIDSGKNLVGAFRQPAMVVADVDALRTLPQNEFRAGMAEVVKHGLLDPAILETVRDNTKELAKGPAAESGLLVRLVEQNVRCKAAVVAADEREAGVRAHLNLGHTFAHAIEATLGYGSLLHGEAVSMGLVAACSLAARLGIADASLQREVGELLAGLGLPVRIPKCDAADLMRPMSHDKKAARGKKRFVLASSPGEVEVHADVPDEAVLATLEELIDG